MINHSLETPLHGFMHEKYLYDMDPARNGYIEACLVAINTYPHHAMTVTLMVTAQGKGNGSVFTYLPFDAFTIKPEEEAFSYRSLVYHDCRDGRVDFSTLHSLPREARAFLREEDAWLDCTYIATVDWYDGNDLLNLVLLENGQLAALPFHKLKFGKDALACFEAYKKLHAIWQLDDDDKNIEQ